MWLACGGAHRSLQNAATKWAHRKASGDSTLGHIPDLLTGFSTALGIADHIGSAQDDSQHHNQCILCTI